MDAKTRLAKLMRISDPAKLSDEELAIEYETELANIDSYRKWLTYLHEEWHRESAAEKQAADPLMTEDGQTYNPAVFSIEKMGLSNKATLALMQMGIEKFGDLENVDPQVLEAIPVIGRRNVEMMERILKAYGLPVFSTKNTKEEKSLPISEEQKDNSNEKKDEASVNDISDAVSAESETEKVSVNAEKEVSPYDDDDEYFADETQEKSTPEVDFGELDDEEVEVDDEDDSDNF